MDELKTDDPALLRQPRRDRSADDTALHQLLVLVIFDLFGSEQSSNAAGYFANGVKGRPNETPLRGPQLPETVEAMDIPDDNGVISTVEVPTRNAMNEITRGRLYSRLHGRGDPLEPDD